MSVGIPAESDMFYDDGVLRSSTTARTYGGIDRAARPLLTSGKPKVLEPTSIDKATPEWRFGIDYASAKDVGYVEILRPILLMRALGYTRHPYDCSHYRKRLMIAYDAVQERKRARPRLGAAKRAVGAVGKRLSAVGPVNG